MDFNLDTIIPALVGAVLGIGAVSSKLGKFLPIAKKYIGIAKNAVDLNDALIRYIEDDKITEEEYKDIKTRVLSLKASIKS